MARVMEGRVVGNAATALRRRRRAGQPMAEYDRLPPELRLWLAQAVLPWSPRSALRVWQDALGRSGGDRAAGHAALAAAEAARLARDTCASHR